MKSEPTTSSRRSTRSSTRRPKRKRKSTEKAESLRVEQLLIEMEKKRKIKETKNKKTTKINMTNKNKKNTQSTTATAAKKATTNNKKQSQKQEQDTGANNINSNTKKRRRKDIPNTIITNATNIIQNCNGETRFISNCLKDDNKDDHTSTTSSSLDEKDIICCICHCSVDFSEKDVFSPQNNNHDDNNNNLDQGDKTDDNSKSCHSNTRSGSNSSECDSINNEKEENSTTSDIKNIKKHNNDKINDHNHYETNNHHNKEDIDNETSSVPYCGVKLPNELYDPNNALLICDRCNRSYHQRCHFVPIFCLPRGNWYCLICQYKDNLLKECSKNNASSKKKKKQKKEQATKRKKRSKCDDNYNSAVDDDDDEIIALSTPLTIDEIDSLFPIPRDYDDDNTKNDGNDAINEGPNEIVKPLVSIQYRFEFQTASLKASMLHTELRRRVKTTIDSAIGAIRLEQHTIRGYTETERAKKSLVENFERSKKLPQQLVQSVDRMAHNKLRIRALMLSIDSVIRNRDDRKLLDDWYSLKRGDYCQKNEEASNKTIDNIDLLKSELFRGSPTRQEPRFALGDYDGDIESEDDDEDDPTKKIKCTVCFNGKVGKDNDVIMCDGENCFRAFHMKCCNPIVTQKMLDDDERGTWFCQYCYTLANAIHYTQSEYNGDEYDSEDDSVSSWDEAQDVFPEAAIELQSAKLWKRGRRNETSDKYLNSLLGIELSGVVNKYISDDETDHDESDHNYSMTDEEDNNSLSDSGSEGSNDYDVPLKWEVEKDELEALSQSTSQDSYSYDNRHSTRKLRSSNKSKGKKSKDIGTIDVDNIVYVKRNRSKVDYKRLNGSLFGEADKAGNNTDLDDEDEFDGKSDKKRETTSSSNDSANGSDESLDNGSNSETDSS